MCLFLRITYIWMIMKEICMRTWGSYRDVDLRAEAFFSYQELGRFRIICAFVVHHWVATI